MKNMHTREEKLEAFGRLLDVLDTLREKCPWDRKQTNESLRPHTIEETFELCDALLKNDTKNVCKELGDVFMHVCFYALIGSEKGEFDIADVCNTEADKLIFRHPHVYGEVKADTEDKVLQNWEQIKLKEKDGNKMPDSTGKTKATCGPRCVKNLQNWKLNSDARTRKNQPRNLEISSSVSSMQPGCITSTPTMPWNMPIRNSSAVSTILKNKPKSMARC